MVNFWRIAQPNAEPPNTHRDGVPDCCQVDEAMVEATPTVVSARAHASEVVPGIDDEADRKTQLDPVTNESGLFALTATKEIAVADAVVMMSGVGTNCEVADVENPDCTWLARKTGAATPEGTS